MPDDNKEQTEIGAPFDPANIAAKPAQSGDWKLPPELVPAPNAGAAAPHTNVIEPDVRIDLTADGNKPEPRPEVKLVFCPACGASLDRDTREVVPTADEKLRWIRHVLGEPRFCGVYSLFGGKAKIVLRSRLTRENDLIFEQLSDEVRAGLMPEVPAFASPAYVARMHRLMLAYSLASLEFDTGDKVKIAIHKFPDVTDDVYPPETKDGVRWRAVAVAQDRVVASLSEALLSGVLAVHRKFEMLMTALIRHTEDPDFWLPAGAGS